MSILPWRWKIFKRKDKVAKQPVVKQSKARGSIDERVRRVNCINLVPPVKGIKRWHCNTGTGMEGDCDLFRGKNDNCQYHSPKFIPLTPEQIQEKVWALKEWNAFVEECVSVRICPKDGHELDVHFDDCENEPIDEVECPICGFTRSI